MARRSQRVEILRKNAPIAAAAASASLAAAATVAAAKRSAAVTRSSAAALAAATPRPSAPRPRDVISIRKGARIFDANPAPGTDYVVYKREKQRLPDDADKMTKFDGCWYYELGVDVNDHNYKSV